MKKLLIVFAFLIPCAVFGSIDLDTPEGRKNWWDGLREDWQNFFASGYYYDSPGMTPTDKQLVELLNTKSLSLDNDDECGLGPMYEADISDLTGLKHLKHLEELSMSFCKFKNFEPLIHNKKLQRLWLHYAEFESWDGFEQLTGLVQFSTTRAEAGLFARINKLTNLKGLTLYEGSGVAIDLSQLGNLLNLESLSISYYGNDNDNLLDGIGAFANLKELEIEHPGSYLDLRKLRPLQQLDKIVITDTRIDYVESLGALVELEQLQLNNSIDDLRGEQFDLKVLKPCVNLWNLDIAGYEITNPESIKHLRLLQHLTLTSCDEFNMNWLSEHTRMSNMEIRTQKFLNLAELAQLPKLQSLILHSNSIKSFAELPVLGKVYYLKISSQNISTLTGAEKWQELTAIDVTRCPKLNDYSSLKNTPKLNRVHVHNDHYEAVRKLLDPSKVEVYDEMDDVGGC